MVEGSQISWTLILGVTFTSLALVALGLYVWWTRFVKNRRKNLVIPKPIVEMRTRPSATYQQVLMSCQIFDAEDDINFAYSKQDTVQLNTTHLKNEDSSKWLSTLLGDEEDDAKLLKSFLVQARNVTYSSCE
jgi:hypothetical protein